MFTKRNMNYIVFRIYFKPQVTALQLFTLYQIYGGVQDIYYIITGQYLFTDHEADLFFRAWIVSLCQELHQTLLSCIVKGSCEMYIG